MTDFDAVFRGLDVLRSPDLSTDIDRRSKNPAPPDRTGERHLRRRLPAFVVAFAVFLASAAFLWEAFRPVQHQRQHPPVALVDPWVRYGNGWTQLPDPPKITRGAAEVWTGSTYLYWGGVPLDSNDPSPDGYAFDPTTRTWSNMAPAPRGLPYAHGIWTGSLAIFWGGSNTPNEGFAYDPAARTWKHVPPAPMDPAYRTQVVWTGSEMIAWGAGRNGLGSSTGAAFDPGSWSWHPIAKTPLTLNAFTAVWTGTQVVVFGAELDGRNHASTPTAVGEAYSPDSDTWRLLPRSALSPQASTVAWVDGRLVAYDYVLVSATLDRIDGRWTGLPQVPLRPGECYPDSAVVGATMIAFYCGQGAAWNEGTSWTPITGGLLNETLGPADSQMQLYRFADLTTAGPVLVFAAEGITVDHGGSACYGCSGTPHQFWVYRPPAVDASPGPSSASLARPEAAHIRLTPGESRTFPPGELHTGDIIACPGRGTIAVSVPGQFATSSIGLTANRGLNSGVYAHCDGGGS